MKSCIPTEVFGLWYITIFSTVQHFPYSNALGMLASPSLHKCTGNFGFPCMKSISAAAISVYTVQKMNRTAEVE
jgi:hypothetical protein